MFHFKVSHVCLYFEHGLKAVLGKKDKENFTEDIRQEKRKTRGKASNPVMSCLPKIRGYGFGKIMYWTSLQLCS